jgi:hypothetical protein
MKPKLIPPEANRLKLKCDILLSTSAFKISLHRYSWGAGRRKSQEKFREVGPARYCSPRQTVRMIGLVTPLSKPPLNLDLIFAYGH